MNKRRICAAVIATGATFGGLAGLVGTAGPAAAAAKVTCTGTVCINDGDTTGRGTSFYVCPDGSSYPTVTIVPPKSTVSVTPPFCPPSTTPGSPFASPFSSPYSNPYAAPFGSLGS
ncbi:hypothetical protein [Gordonia soli]|uniref:Uncharacterized protein n=1 Tax=Gordonia soli NBRC 108243 TaxID=1223545 RepID=M0QHU6_9ACTN|nr:hypothetical protein [Gordonia soli]GAC66992.1 hypothetical protein GS4_05_02050 [Gordonia soli NBRC 108243]